MNLCKRPVFLKGQKRKRSHKNVREDKKYRAWIQRQPSCISGLFSEYLENGEGRCEAAHVRDATNSGWGMRPIFSCLPLTRHEHALQTQYGYEYFYPMSWWWAKVEEYLVEWEKSPSKKYIGLFKDLTGKKFGRITVISHDGVTGSCVHRWNCRCECGTEKSIAGGSLTQGLIVSCGCYNKEKSIEVHTKHGHAGMKGRTPEYRCWQGLIQRCTNPKAKAFRRYGARGIKVCLEWLDFNAFLRDMSARPPGTSLDRIDNNGNYEPGNCRWATKKEQSRNTRRNVRYLIEGEMLTIIEIAEKYKLDKEMLRSRIRKGWEIVEAVKTPPLYIRKKKLTITG